MPNSPLHMNLRFAKEKLPKFIAKAYEVLDRLWLSSRALIGDGDHSVCQEKPDAEEALKSAFEAQV